MLPAFREIVLADFEFESGQGDRPVPVCLVAHEVRSGRQFRIFQDQLGAVPPHANGTDVLFVAYYASAELGCYRALGWPMPPRILDLFTEFRDRTNGLPTPAGAGLLGALTYFGIDGMAATEKKEIQEAIGNRSWRGRYTPAEILDYCAQDVAALAQLLLAMLPQIDLPRSLLRGRYMAAAAAMEFAGTPIDTEMLAQLRAGWTDIQDQLIAEIDSDYGVFDGRTFKADRFAAWLGRKSIPWPLLESGRLDLSDDTFRQMAKSYPAVSPLRELRSALSELRLNDLAVGRDGRNRTILSALRAHRPQSAEQLQVHFRSERLVAWADQAAARLRRGLCGLETTRVRHRRGAVGRRGHAGRLSIRRSVFGVCEASWGRPGCGHQGNARAAA
jgi:hypothetical protein